MRRARPGWARFGGRLGTGVVSSADVARDGLPEPGWWAVVGEFEGTVRAWRFAEVVTVAEASPVPGGPRWTGPDPAAWTSGLDRACYLSGVREIRRRIADGTVYQVNLCRVMRAPLPGGATGEPDAAALAARLRRHHPAPYAGAVHVPAGGPHPPVWVVTASPELFLRIEDGVVASGPIKGTARTAAGLTAKDRAENVMITDLVRNDLQRVCRPGTVEVVGLLAEQAHPGLVHLVSTVQGVLWGRPGVDLAWSELLAATYPPGSVSGAPKSSALRAIADLEPEPRGPYCGAVGWVEVGADGGVRAELAVGIRTFWWTPQAGGTLHFGTGAGITADSDPAAEWAETELKADRLVALASTGAGPATGTRPGRPSDAPADPPPGRPASPPAHRPAGRSAPRPHPPAVPD